MLTLSVSSVISTYAMLSVLLHMQSWLPVIMFLMCTSLFVVIMEKKHKDLLVDNHTFLMGELDFVNTHLYDYMYSDGLLTYSDIEQIEVSYHNLYAN